MKAVIIKKRQQGGNSLVTRCNIDGMGIALVHFFLGHAGGIVTGDAQALGHRVIFGVYFSGPQKASVGAMHHMTAAAQSGFGWQLV